MKKIYFILFIIMSYACSSDKMVKSDYPKFDIEAEIEGVAYNIKDAYGCGSMCYMDSMLVLFNSGNKAFNVYDSNNGKFLSSYGFIGRADDEYLSVLNCGIDPQDKSTVVIQDITKAKMSHVKINRYRDSIGFERVKYYDFNPLPMVLKPEFIENGYSVGNILLSSEYKDFLVLMDENNIIKANFCNPLNLNIEEKNIMNGNISHINNKFVFACRSFGYISFYSVENGAVSQEWEYLLKDVKYGINNKGQLKWNSEDNYSGFYDVFINDKYVVATYGGVLNDSELPNTILIFDHTGKPIAKLTTSRSIVYSAMSDDGRKIYTYDGDETLVVYDIDTYLR